jgi:hypothetical protein
MIMERKGENEWFKIHPFHPVAPVEHHKEPPVFIVVWLLYLASASGSTMQRGHYRQSLVNIALCKVSDFLRLVDSVLEPHFNFPKDAIKLFQTGQNVLRFLL